MRWIRAVDGPLSGGPDWAKLFFLDRPNCVVGLRSAKPCIASEPTLNAYSVCGNCLSSQAKYDSLPATMGVAMSSGCS